MKKTLLALILLLNSNSSIYESYGTVTIINNQTSWGVSAQDVVIRGDDGKLFMIHLHEASNFKIKHHYYLIYTNVRSSCETGWLTRIEFKKER